MKKNLVALVVSGAVCAPAIAQTNVTIYGSFNVALERVRAEDATASTAALNSMVGAPGLTPAEFEWRNRVTSTNSNIGFRGTEDLGNGLKAIFQCESFANIDNGSPGPAGTILCNRNSNVGLSGGWGTVFYGIWDTPYKITTIKLDTFTVYDGNHEVLMGSPGFNVSATTRSGRTEAQPMRRFNAATVTACNIGRRTLAGSMAVSAMPLTNRRESSAEPRSTPISGLPRCILTRGRYISPTATRFTTITSV
jgi:Gram-negative porin